MPLPQRFSVLGTILSPAVKLARRSTPPQTYFLHHIIFELPNLIMFHSNHGYDIQEARESHVSWSTITTSPLSSEVPVMISAVLNHMPPSSIESTKANNASLPFHFHSPPVFKHNKISRNTGDIHKIQPKVRNPISSFKHL